MTRPPTPFSHQELPLAAPSTGPEATYSNVGLATIPRARLAVSSGVWTGARLVGGPIDWTLPSDAGGAGLIPGRGAKITHVSKGQKKITEQKQYCNKFNKHYKNGPP